MNVFYLMHRDDKIAVFDMDNDRVSRFKIIEDRHILPYGVHDLRSFMCWLVDRAIPEEWYSCLGNDCSRLQFLLNNNSLSLSDSYWTCPAGTVPCWSEINLYDNFFAATAVLDNFNEIKTIAYKPGFTPNSSLKGDLVKKWIIDSSGNRILLKGSSSQNALQTVSEVLATAMYSACDINFVEYNFADVFCNGEKKLGCACKNFTTPGSEFIPAIDIVNSGKKGKQ